MSRAELEALAAHYRGRLEAHPLYARLHSLDDVRGLMRGHVFAVWDFMSLLKALQLRLTGLSLPWRPVGDAAIRRMINEMVLGEESDHDPEGGYCSHFELYLRAMQACGADTAPIERLLAALETESLPQALQRAELDPEVQAFVETTWSFVEAGSLPALAAAFGLGREDVIPGMFRQMVSALAQDHPGLRLFQIYLQRHIELDGDEHGPLAWHMLERICDQTPQGWSDALAAAEQAFEARLRLWDGLLARIEAARITPVPVLV
ncbi:MAG: DUF3050 domain-containing protein [Candidatus Sericytochromatia bacterium]